MAACTTYFDSAKRKTGLHKSPIIMRNCWLSSPCAAAACARPRSCSPSTLTTRVSSKRSDPVRVRQMRIFSAAVAVLFSLVMVYGLQHFSAIEGSYRVESEKQQLDQLREENRQLRLSEAQLAQPARIDGLAHQMGLAAPEPGQVVHATAHADNQRSGLRAIHASSRTHTLDPIN